jgi:hypothetical protein
MDVGGPGPPRENFTSPVGKNFPGPALPDFSLEKFGRRDGYHQYEVLHESGGGTTKATPACSSSACSDRRSPANFAREQNGPATNGSNEA